MLYLTEEPLKRCSNPRNSVLFFVCWADKWDIWWVKDREFDMQMQISY